MYTMMAGGSLFMLRVVINVYSGESEDSESHPVDMASWTDICLAIF